MKRPAVFLDRDGVIIKEIGYISSSEEMKIYNFSKECVENLRKHGYLSIVITNQSGIARGFFSEDDLIKMNQRLMEETGVDDVFYCPHYKQGIVPKYSIECNCRKPGVGMIEKACTKYDIDLKQSFFIGDRESDIKAGKNAGIKTILVRSGYGKKEEKKDINPDHICDDLRDAVMVCINEIGEGQT